MIKSVLKTGELISGPWPLLIKFHILRFSVLENRHFVFVFILKVVLYRSIAGKAWAQNVKQAPQRL